MRNSLFAGVLFLGLLWETGVARADIPPPDACTSPGQPCQVAGPQYDQPGTCQPSTCTKAPPDGDGGVTIMMYPCNLCISGAGGHGGAGGTAGSAAGGASGVGGAGGQGTSPGPKPQPSKSGCAVAGDGTPLGLGTLLLLALVFLRRRASMRC